MPVVPVLTSARFLFAQGELDHGPAGDEADWAELVEADVGDEDASLAGSYWSSGYAGFLETGEISRLDLYRRTSVGGYPLVTDPDLIEDFYFTHGHIDFQEYYQS